MSPITDKINLAANRNKELLTTLSKTDHARPELEQQELYIADLVTEIALSRQHVDQLDKKRQKELKEHASYRDSVMKRFAYKVVGKKERFEEKANKEEKEYFSALQEEHAAQSLLRGREEAMEDAKRAREELRGLVEKHDRAQRELDVLYEDIFQGPTPGFEEEDRVEEAMQRAKEAHHMARSRAEAQAKAVQLLEAGMEKMNGARGCMDEALGHSRMDMWGGGTFTDMMERNALSKAGVLSTEARLAASQASRFDGEIGALPQVNVPEGDLLTDVFFDNIITDMAFHAKIQQGIQEMEQVRQVLRGELDRARERGRRIGGEVAQRQAELETARSDLQKTREKIFQKLSGSQEKQGKSGQDGIAGNGSGTSTNPFWR